MAVSHVFSNTIANWTGTVTVGNSAGGTQTIEASALVRPQDWNSAHNQFYTLSGNTNNASTASGTNVVFAASHGVTLDGSTGTIVWRGPRYHNLMVPGTGVERIVGQHGNSSMHVQPVYFPYLEHDRVILPLQFSGATNSTGSLTVSFWWGLYTKNVSTLSSAFSSSGSTAITYSGTANSTLNSGPRIVSFGWTNTVPAGDYYLGFVSRTTTGGANASLSNYLATQIASAWSGYLGSVSSNSVQMPLGLGYWTVQSAGIPASVAFSDIWGTQSLVQRLPMMTFLSGTA